MESKTQSIAELSPNSSTGSGFSATLPRNLTNAQYTRKQAEIESQKLQNRIKLLQLEEKKAQRKIQETKKRVSSIDESRVRNEVHYQEKLRHKQEKNRQFKEANDRINKFRQDSHASKGASQRQLMEKRKSDVRMIRNSSVMNDRVKTDMIKQNELRNKMKAMSVRKFEADGHQKVTTFLQSREAQNRQDYEMRVIQQESKTRGIEDEVMRMEQIEMELIKKLQYTQTLQQKTFDDLETALLRSKQSPRNKLG